MNATSHHSSCVFRSMREEDIEQVMAIENVAYQFPWTQKIFIDCLDAGYHCWVIERGQSIVGYVVFITAVGECHLLNICIDPRSQGCGLGRELLSKVLESVVLNEVRCIFLEVRPSNRHAIQLYESLGFNEVGIRQKYYPTKHGREDAIIFAKEL